MVGVPVEILFTALFGALAVLFATAHDLSFVLPAPDGAALFGVSYAAPLAAALVWSGCMVHGGGFGRRVLVEMVVALGCYVAVMWLHFNLKLWAPLINPYSWDPEYDRIDGMLRGVVEAAFVVRAFVGRVVPFADVLYVHLFLAMFVFGFCIHAARSREVFREVFLASLYVQGLGALLYIAFPAVGPFLYEPGVNPVATAVQAQMLEVRLQLEAGGAAWVAQNGSRYLFSGLAAMPSLHTGGAALFVWYAWRHERRLLWIQAPAFLFILVAAVASRWHYLIDLPAGLLLAAVAIVLSRLSTAAARRPREIAPSRLTTAEA